MSRKIIFNQNQLSLPLGERRLRSASFEDRERAFWFLVSVSICSLFIYIYAINATAHHIAVREHLERGVAEVEARLSALEFSAIALRNEITLEIAQVHGFAEVKTPLYVSREAAPALTLNTAPR